MSAPLLYRAAQRGVYGCRREYGMGSITDALFVYLDGEPDPESAAALDRQYRNRPLVCMRDAWEQHIRTRYSGVKTYRRCRMKPAGRFLFPEKPVLPDGYRLSLMDGAAFERHPFGHGEHYASYSDFRETGSGAVIRKDGEIVSAASSFLSLDGEAELDMFTKEDHRGKGLAAACAARMLRDCTERGIIVHWDAQNDISRHLAEKFGFEPEAEYTVFWLPEKRGEYNNGTKA